ncbi:hypothetical protein AB7160_01275 [Morganella morganii]|uniref:hypothetical protein n=1 Tax=Morganella morganii TaxID=582 RepID=UPI001165C042|nr:hypothetical protein [Morganella morganii]QQO71077.1 hypothetical protein IDH72_10925 [Morganella morganii]
MKLLVMGILFSTSVIAANHCKPDDVCLSFKTSKDELSIACKNIESAKISTVIEKNDSLDIYLNGDTGLSDFSAKNMYQTAELYINGTKYSQAVITSRMSNSIRINVKDNPDFQLVDNLMKCVD